MKRARKYIPLPERLAAALAMLLPQEQRDDLRARQVGCDAVCELFDMDHVVLHAIGGEDRWWNLTPMLREIHRGEKSPRDTKIAAKIKRLRGETCNGPKKPWLKGRKLQSRGFERRV